MISEKDRSQLLRMAGNIACGIVTANIRAIPDDVAKDSVYMAWRILENVDSLILASNTTTQPKQKEAGE